MKSKVDSPRADLTSLVPRIRSGDPAAEDSFAARYRREILVFMRARIGDVESARDLTQDALLAALSAVRDGKVREPAHLTSFVLGTARNLANNYLRTRPRQARTIGGEVEQIPQEHPNHLDNAARVALVRRALGSLSEGDRQILLMTLVEGLKTGVIALRLGLKPDVLRKRKSRALHRVISAIRKSHERLGKTTKKT